MTSDTPMMTKGRKASSRPRSMVARLLATSTSFGSMWTTFARLLAFPVKRKSSAGPIRFT